MKKTLSMLLIITFLFSAAACSSLPKVKDDTASTEKNMAAERLDVEEDSPLHIDYLDAKRDELNKFDSYHEFTVDDSFTDESEHYISVLITSDVPIKNVSVHTYYPDDLTESGHVMGGGKHIADLDELNPKKPLVLHMIPDSSSSGVALTYFDKDSSDYSSNGIAKNEEDGTLYLTPFKFR
ncbi:MAG: hypothetical protein Q4E22_05395 [Coriobacteriia bacterium]|nr:hypothetical protein [Coriobacteriia bacterium]